MAKLEALFVSPECDIYYNTELHIVQSRWKGVYAEGQRLQDIFDQLILALQTKNCSMIIADAREMFVIAPKDRQWTIDEWYPRAVKAGFKYQGLILSKDTFNELSVKQISAHYDENKVATMYFTSPSAALDLVRSVASEERILNK